MGMYEEMVNIAKANGLEITENTYKIAAFRERTKMPIHRCPCAPLDDDRGCIGKKCWAELNSAGICHCGAYRKV